MTIRCGFTKPVQSARLCDCGIEMVEPMGIAPTEILLAKQTPLLHSDHGPIVNHIVNYTKLVDSAGLEPATARL